MSADGRYVAFSSGAPDLVPGDTNDAYDVFVRDRQAGSTARVSVASDGTEAERGRGSHPGRMGSGAAAISADGRYVAFQSNNLVSGDDNADEIVIGGDHDVFVHDRLTHTTERVSLNSVGSEANGHSGAPSISADGRYVAFESQASNLTCRPMDAAPLVCDPTVLDTNDASDVFVRDRLSGTTTRVSVASDGTQAVGHSYEAAISADGGHVAFASQAVNLVTGDTSARTDVFVHERQTATTTRVSVKSDGTEANESSYDEMVDISGDGRHVVFTSYASNLVDGDTNQAYDVFVHDRQTAMTTRVSVSGAGKQAQNEGDSYEAAISADGRYVVFQSYAPNLVPGDTNGYTDVFVRNLQIGSTTRVNVASDGTQADAPFVNGVAISADGRYVAFDSNASNLVPWDTNGTYDVFVHQPMAPPSVSVGDATVQEGDAGTRAVFTVSLSQASIHHVTVNYATAKGTATGADFTAKSGTLSFAPGTTSLKLKVAITPDTLVEGAESFNVNLSGANGATISDGSGVGTIVDDD